MAQAMASQTLDGHNVSPSPVPTPEDIAGNFPQFEILGCLGRGGMGVVYKAIQKSLNRMVAIKILAPERVGQEKFAERFAREAQTLAQLNHPNIVTVFDYGETGGLYYFVMEFVDGVNLRDLLSDGKLEPQQALAIVPPVCEALQYAHDKGIVHRDIKPENLLLDKEGRVKIADFGIAALVGAVGESSGTPPYMAPEQAGPSPEVDHRADIYALGVVLYEMLTGERPNKELVAPSRKVQIDVRLDEIVLRALEKNPELRYQQASIFKTQVETIASTSGRGPAHVGPENTKADQSQTTLPPAELNPWQPVNPPPSPPAAWFSRTAIFGACWAAFFFITLPLGVVAYQERIAHPGAQLCPGWKTKILLTLLFIGIAAPFGTTILGWVSVTKIRHAAGKLYGMGLAVFDGLLFPLLALDAVIVSPIVLVVSQTHRVNPAVAGQLSGKFYVVNEMLPLALMLVAFIAVDYFIIRHVWRAVNKPVVSSTPDSPALADKQTPPALPQPIPPDLSNMGIRNMVKGPAIGLIVTGIFNLISTAVFIVLGLGLRFSPAAGHGVHMGLAGVIVLLALLAMSLSGFVIYAGFKMMRLERRGAALAASTLVLLLAPGNVIGLAIGIWSLVVLNRNEVRMACDAAQRRRSNTKHSALGVALAILICLMGLAGITYYMNHASAYAVAADFRCRVFIVDAKLVDQWIPPDMRHSGVQANARCRMKQRPLDRGTVASQLPLASGADTVTPAELQVWRFVPACT